MMNWSVLFVPLTGLLHRYSFTLLLLPPLLITIDLISPVAAWSPIIAHPSTRLQYPTSRPVKVRHHRDFPGGAVGWGSMLPVRGAGVRSLVGELDPTRMPRLGVCVPQLRSW